MLSSISQLNMPHKDKIRDAGIETSNKSPGIDYVDEDGGC